jgi:hypothetical protein
MLPRKIMENVEIEMYLHFMKGNNLEMILTTGVLKNHCP